MSNTRLSKIQKSIADCSEGAAAFKSCSSGIGDTFSSNASVYVRDGYTRSNYEAVRPNERVPVEFLESLSFCNDAYYSVAIVRNVIDLMSDFCVKGIDWVHPNRNVQAFYKEWGNTCDWKNVSERFCNYLFRLANTAVIPELSVIPLSIADQWKRTRGSEFKNVKVKKREIPSSYSFLDVTALQEELSPEALSFGQRVFRVNNSGGLISSFSNYNVTFRSQKASSFSGKLYQSLPKHLRDRISENNGNLTLVDGTDIYLYHYRKDDWDTWARPIILSIAEPLIMLKKMHLADMSALDGVISNVRLWKIGYIDQTNVLNSIIPSADMLTKFSNLLKQNLAGGVLDIVWGPDLDFKESSSNSHHFLFPDKYSQLMSEIYDGLGVNPSLAGGSAAGSTGMTNNAISMKVLVERLSYVRNKLREFWMRESVKVQKAMGFSSPAILQFDDAIFSDEISYKKLLIELYDRDIISQEGLRDEFNIIDPIESKRVLREVKRRTKEVIPPKASPFHDPMIKTKLMSDLVKGGGMDGDELNVDVKKEDVVTKDPGGRPIGKKDSIKRDPKKVSPKKAFAGDFLEMQVWAREALDSISNIVGDAYLQEKSKANFRQLNDEEAQEYEDFKLSILMGLKPFSNIDINSIQNAVANIKPTAIERQIRDTLLAELPSKINRSITMDDKRIAASAAYAMSVLSENDV